MQPLLHNNSYYVQANPLPDSKQMLFEYKQTQQYTVEPSDTWLNEYLTWVNQNQNTDTHVTISKSTVLFLRLLIPIILAEVLISVYVIVGFAMKINYLLTPNKIPQVLLKTKKIKSS